MTSWQQLEPWLRLSCIQSIGPVRVQRLLQHFKSPQQVLSASLAELKAGIPEACARAIVEQKNSGDIAKKLDKARGWMDASEAHHILCVESDAYPVQLKELPDPPSILYVVGNPVLLSEPQLAIVGSRRPTPQGRRVAAEIAGVLARSGFVITSGMAMGIDGAAHQGTLAGYGNTVAVLGTGVDQVYPRSHLSLYSEIIEQGGAIVSELPLGTSPNPANFPRRNRVISGLSLGVLVVEAAIESGSLISARLAAEQGREVFAIPGSVMNPLSKGCHKLIREGAVLVESAEDILLELKPEIQHLLLESEGCAVSITKCTDPAHKKILEAMGFDVISPDLISSLCSIPYDELSVILTDMELSGFIQSVPGGFLRSC
ncbi:DNA-processing protein DprA [Endozoicomonas sp. Mp262]|uniref:DNA-processing protein DprA n=1 Tax=Endozoicomonas sp. Mp262 TaxID=2919499 RepID=UPI0021D80C1C